MRTCREYGWKYIFTLKDKRPKGIAHNYAALRALHGCEEKTGFGPEKGIASYANHLEEISQKAGFTIKHFTPCADIYYV